ncbi:MULTISPECIES: serine/threonine-protein kinase [Streptomyces]|uniref:non-specific serine/threonine protein kinase n=1 Tax=Streptomyces chartreusis NRRL 3882 TaxID=1079985 RepID=A0A2N9B8I9_STRCX|nr:MULTISPECIES: serine/threonine-protein kinase [Streptomyces]MYS89401.1 protein kinase [Streptomyces sp. SID5464]SOR79650.1 Serine/threonine-protein kinase PknA [Streptomyces chartreusis NRRL 3882]
MQGLLVAGRYRLADSIGSGGMGRVWRAHDEVLHRSVAIKELTAALYVSESEQAILLARTRAEARAAARINHSAVVTVHDVLEHDGRPWIVMELVEGRSLADAVKEDGRVEPREAARIGMWVLRALRAAHAAGVLHRDVKPGNVLLGRDGRVLLTDFGIAQIEGDTTITRTGEVVGSVDYLAPERVRGHDPGPSSDLWALGATLYTAVEGRSPFRRTTPLTTMQAVVEEEAAELQHAGALTPVITALLRKDPAARPDASEAEQMLAEAAEGRRPNGAQAYVPTQYGGSSPYRDAHSGRSASGTNPSGTNSSGTGAVGNGSGSHTRTPLPPLAGTPAGGTPTAGAATAGTPTAGAATAGTPAAGAFATGHGTPGPTRLGPMATGPQPAGSGRRRRLRTLALVVALAAIIGGGTAVALQQWNESRQTASGAAGSSGTTSTEQPGSSVPAGWTRRDDPAGFSLYLPKGWKRQTFGPQGELKQIDYTPDGGRHFVRIAVDTSPDFADPYAHQLDLEQQLQRLVDYKRVKLERNVYRDRDGALWEYTWTAQPKDTKFPGPRRAIEETYVARDGTEYALYMSAPARDWAKARKQFTSLLQGWHEKTP